MFVLSYFIQVLLSEVPRHYRGCLFSQGNISTFTLCLVPIELKLGRFRKPTFIGLKSGVSCKYLTSISRVFHKPVFIGLNCQCGLHLRLKELLHYCCLSLAASMGTTIELSTIPVRDRLSTILSKPRIIFHVCVGDFGI